MNMGGGFVVFSKPNLLSEKHFPAYNLERNKWRSGSYGACEGDCTCRECISKRV